MRPFARSLCALALAAAAAAPARGNIAKVTLHAEPGPVRAGEPSLAAVRFELPPHWHVYWKNPGDSGTPPSLRWAAGISAGAIQWPAPRLIRVGPLANYGYEREAILLVPIASRTGELRAHAKWLVCQEECIPEDAELTASPPSPGDAALFARAKASLPRPGSEAGFSATLGAQSASTAEVRIAAPPGVDVAQAKATFFPSDGELIEHAQPQPQRLDGTALVLALPRAQHKPGPIAALDGVLLLEQPQVPPLALELSTAAPAATGRATGAAPLSLLLAVGLAFLGGLLLNLMPCVLPVLALKALGFARAVQGHPREARAQALWFAAGVLASFWALAAALLAVRASGAQLGWGFQLQNPAIVAGLALLFFVMGLAFLGAVELGGSLASLAGGAQLDQAERGGPLGSFASGVLATAVATPCTAPFMGSALGFALVSPVPHALAVFTALGLGMALPYVALSASPRAAKLVPRPGPWMDVLKQALAFPLFATAVWLLWVLSLQSGDAKVLATLAAMVVIGFGLWVFRTAGGPLAPAWRRRTAALVAAGSVLAGLAVAVGAPPQQPRAAAKAGDAVAWVDWSPSKLAALRAEGKPVYLDFTAAWCITCQVNKRIVFSSAEVLAAFAQRGVVPMRADWTNRDDAIGRALAEHGRSGVPLNILYAGKAEPHVLPTVLTPGIVLDALAHAGAPVR